MGRARKVLDRTALDSISLTPRELEVLKLLVTGHTVKDIGKILVTKHGSQIATRTAAAHKENVMKKLGIHTLADLVAYALHEAIIIPGE